MDVAAYFPWC